MEELWKDIENYDGYQVSNYGRIRTFNKKTYTKKHGIRIWKDRILKPKISKKDNCSRIDLWKDGKHKTILVHRLVANAFLEKQLDKKMTVNHIDGNRLNNRIDNLEWLTRKDNIRDAFEKNLYTTQKNCILYDSKNKKYNFLSLSKASKFIGRNKGYISNCIKLNRKIISQNGEVFRIS